MSGTETPNLPRANGVDTLVGNSAGNTVLIELARLAAILSSLQGPSYATLGELNADLAWPAGAVGTVYSGGNAGVYRKSGAAGSGGWAKIGDLPVSALTAAQLAEKAAVADLLAETTARIAATRDTGVLPLANVSGANNMVADLTTASGVASLSGTATVELIPIETNWDAATLNVGGAGAWAILRRNGSPVQPGDLKAGHSYLLRRRGSSWRAIGLLDSDVQGKVDAEAQSRAAAIENVEKNRIAGDAILQGRITDEAQARAEAIAGVVAPLGEPFATQVGSGMRVLRTDATGNAIEVWRDSGGLDAIMASEFWARGKAGVGVTALEAKVSAPSAAPVITDGWVMRTDQDGNAIEIMRPDGIDMIMSKQFWARAGVSGGGSMPAAGLSTTAVDIIATDGQSLTVSGDFTSSMTKSSWQTWRSDAALMLTGMRRGDGVPLTDVAGPRSQGYDTATPATGMARAEPPGAAALAFPVAVALNLHRADLGVPQVPVLTTSHGISGIPIEDMDASATTGAGGTTVWGNVTYWSAEARRVIEAAGKTVRQPWHVWTHGTSAKAKARGEYAALWWSLRNATVAQWQSQGLPVPRYIMTQCGGDANTVGDSWAVCDDQLDICEAGGAVLATPLYWYEIADNNVHPDAKGVTLFGETYAWAMAEVEAGRTWTLRRPRATWDATASVLVLDFDSLREDEWLVAEDAAKYAASGGVGLGADALGFEAVGAAITGVALRGRTARLSCSAQPTQVRYALQIQDMTGFAGNRFNAHRGLLRTSTRKPSKLVPGKMLVRAVPSFTIDIA